MMQILMVVGALAAAACGGKEPTEGTPSCAARAAELRTYLRAVLDPASTVAAPWPTGDAAFDAELPAMRERVRAQAKPADPAQRQAPLTQGVEPGRLEAELASCPGATAQLEKVGEVAPAQRSETFVGLADVIAACDCKASIPRVKALVYLVFRSPD